MIKVSHLKVQVSNFLLQDVNLDVDSGEYFIVLGPTGAGKTVLLEAIAGLYPILEGTITINGRDVTRLGPEKRGIVIVYQDQALFPHLSVAENVAFGLKSKRYSRSEIATRITDIAEVLGVADLLRRRPATLSGGEKQKVALARALVTEPDALLLDEPLSALDPQTKERMQRELMEIHRRLGVSVIHVTHDFEEAITLGDRVAVVNQGEIVQVGTPGDILRRPKSEFVANFALSQNVFSGEAKDDHGNNVTVDIGGVRLVVMTALRGMVHVSVRPEDIFISGTPLGSIEQNAFDGVITDVVDRGSVIYVRVNVPPDFVCLATRQSFGELNLSKGERVWIAFKTAAAHVF